jgi:hypothetical protein
LHIKLWGKDLFDLDHEVDLNQVLKNSIESQMPRRRRKRAAGLFERAAQAWLGGINPAWESASCAAVETAVQESG